MNRDDIIRELGWERGWVTESDLLDRIERIVRLAEAAEREACAKLCLEEAPSLDGQLCADAIRDAIRARGDE